MTPQEFSENFQRQPAPKRICVLSQLDRLLSITAPPPRRRDEFAFDARDEKFLKTLRISAE